MDINYKLLTTKSKVNVIPQIIYFVLYVVKNNLLHKIYIYIYLYLRV